DLFDDPYVNPANAKKVSRSKEHLAFAQQAAERSIVLLKNTNHILPLDTRRIHTIAVIGPTAHPNPSAGYQRKKPSISVLDGIKNMVGDNVKIIYEQVYLKFNR
ncbi:MAG: beta-glucosidase, partial [Bacteroidetes bacterium]|nr:beta-glucosidase [Bacteroidota bacterium]